MTWGQTVLSSINQVRHMRILQVFFSLDHACHSKESNCLPNKNTYHNPQDVSQYFEQTTQLLYVKTNVEVVAKMPYKNTSPGSDYYKK